MIRKKVLRKKVQRIVEAVRAYDEDTDAMDAYRGSDDLVARVPLLMFLKLTASLRLIFEDDLGYSLEDRIRRSKINDQQIVQLERRRRDYLRK